MSIGSSFQFHCPNFIETCNSPYRFQHVKVQRCMQLDRLLSLHETPRGRRHLHEYNKAYRPIYGASSRYSLFICRSSTFPGTTNYAPILKATNSLLARSYSTLRGYPLLLQLVPAVGLIAFTVWGLHPLVRYCRRLLLHKNDANWKKSRTHYFLTSYLQPLMLWAGAILVCRVLDPILLHSEASQSVKQRLLNFSRSLSTVLAFAYCLSSLVQQMQKFFWESHEVNDARKMGIQFAGKAIYTAVWVASISLFMELLGFSTQRWLTAGGLGTVLLTLAGREIFTNFLSSIMIHATRPFVLNEWIQTRIEGYEVSGTVEHVGWWSPTVIRGDDREAVHIPNHKFTVTVVRNLSQKTHWRVKTHLAISHLDANKISSIVADMRKVLSKNPQVEQQRLHRRVFLDYIDPENQAFMILISCFVKTSHFEEYLCVKEGILLDLLRVISHHRARLATPIRTVQKIFGDMDLENVPFAETIITRGARNPINGALFLIEPDAKSRPTSRTNEDQSLRSSISTDPKTTVPVSDDNNSEEKQRQKVSPTGDSSLAADGIDQNDESEEKVQHKRTKSAGLSDSTKNSPVDAANTKASNAKDQVPSPDKVQGNSSDSGTSRRDTTQVAAAHVKQEPERASAPTTPVTKSPLEDNIVLEMALEGSKRTLPIEEGMNPSPSEAKELAGQRNGAPTTSSAKDKQDGVTKSQTAPGGLSTDHRDPVT